MVTVWMSSAFNYYLISYQLKYIKGDIYVNGTVAAVSEMIAYVVSGVLVQFMGIKSTLMSSYSLAFIGMVALIFADARDQLMIALAILVCKFGISQAFNVAYVGNIALFPVSIVATSFGICNVVARTAASFAPYLAEIKPSYISLIVFLVISLVALFASTKLRM